MSQGAEQGSQMAFLTKDFHEPGATHAILSGAYVLVFTKTRRYFAGCTLLTALDVHMLTVQEEPKSMHRFNMGLCTALQDFIVHYSANEYGRPEKDVSYPKGTRLYAFRKPEDGKVIRLPRR